MLYNPIPMVRSNLWPVIKAERAVDSIYPAAKNFSEAMERAVRSDFTLEEGLEPVQTARASSPHIFVDKFIPRGLIYTLEGPLNPANTGKIYDATI